MGIEFPYPVASLLATVFLLSIRLNLSYLHYF